MSNSNPKPFSSIQDKNLNRNPVLRDRSADNSTYTKHHADSMDTASSSREANSVEAITYAPQGSNEGGMIGEG